MERRYCVWCVHYDPNSGMCFLPAAQWNKEPIRAPENGYCEYYPGKGWKIGENWIEVVEE